MGKGTAAAAVVVDDRRALTEVNLAGIGDDIGVGDRGALGLAGFNVVVLGRHVG